jgi:hypothetical protein
VSTTIDSAYSPLPALPSNARTFTGSTSSASNHASPEASGRLIEQTIVISAEAMARLKAFQSLQPAGTGAGAGGLIGRKMKLDYIRDTLVPEAFRAQAEAAISSSIWVACSARRAIDSTVRRRKPI